MDNNRDMILVLLVGQSNMAGRGNIEQEDTSDIHGLFKQDRNNNWISATEPLDCYSSSGGVGPGRTFGKLLLANNPGSLIGLVPCAVGGSSLADWQPGVKHYSGVRPYDAMLKRVATACVYGHFTAVLWHQGETDCRLQTEDYQKKMLELIRRMRKDLELEKVPFICGTLGDYLKKNNIYSYSYNTINQSIEVVAQNESHIGLVSSAGLVDQGDGLHFNSASARELGTRYFKEYKKLIGECNNE